MPKTDEGQYELVLENRQVLGIFFVAAILCGVFFALGYIVGKNTGGAYTPTSPAAAAGTAAGTPAGTNEGKKSALAPAQLAAPETITLPATTTPETPAPASPAPAPATAPAPAAEASINLQVAALSKKEDADAMVALLKNKNFAVSLVPGTTDKLYHVQVGPFATVKEAEAVKGKLENEGFKPLVKR